LLSRVYGELTKTHKIHIVILIQAKKIKLGTHLVVVNTKFSNTFVCDEEFLKMNYERVQK